MTLTVAPSRRVAQIVRRPYSDSEVIVVLACRHERIARVGDFEIGEIVPCGWCVRS